MTGIRGAFVFRIARRPSVFERTFCARPPQDGQLELDEHHRPRAQTAPGQSVTVVLLLRPVLRVAPGRLAGDFRRDRDSVQVPARNIVEYQVARSKYLIRMPTGLAIVTAIFNLVNIFY